MTFEHAKDVIVAEFDDEIVLLNTQTGFYYVMNDTGMQVWRLIREKQTFEQIIDTLAEEYEVDESQLRTDVEALLRDLSKYELINEV
jgi:hypothetical protein